MESDKGKEKKPTFVKVPREFIGSPVYKILTQIEVKVLLALMKFANWETGKCWPKMDTLAGLCGSRRQEVWEATRCLECMGIVEIERKRGRGHTNLYTLKLGEANITPTFTDPKCKEERQEKCRRLRKMGR